VEGERVQRELAAILAAVDAETGNNLWAERCDRDLAEEFACGIGRDRRGRSHSRQGSPAVYATRVAFVFLPWSACISIRLSLIRQGLEDPMAKDMDTRLKMGPLKRQWDPIKSRNPLLKNNGINTSALSQMLSKYDADLARYIPLDAEWWKLDKALPPLLATQTDLGKKLEDLDDQVAKLLAKDTAIIEPAHDKLDKLAADPKSDPADILATLDDVVASADDLVIGRAGLWSQIDKIGHQKAQLMTKARDEYRAKISSINKEIDTLQKNCDTLEANIRTEISKCQAQARKLDHKEVADDMDAFIALLKGP
jgi:peptidoglycan hydrolase CwlO-like protein